MLYEYTKTQLPHLQYIHDEVAASAMTDKGIEWCNWEEDDQELKVNFTNTLSTEDEDILDSIVAACPNETFDAPEELRIKNGDKHIGFKSPEVLAEDTIYVLPEDGATGQDITNITIEGDLFLSGMRQINKTVSSGYWHGKNVIFKDIVLFRMSDEGANEIFRFTEDYQDVTLKQVTYVGHSSFNSPPAFNCNGKEAHIVADYVCGLGHEEWGKMAFSNIETLVLQLRNRTSVYLTGELDACWYDGSCKIEGNPTYNTPDHPILTDKEQLLAKNSINGTFTTVDGKTVTVTDGQIISII